jgi:CheY-like chemotaxis protein
LTLVKQISELHGGKVTVKSAGAGRGSEFVMVLPRVSPPEQPELHVQAMATEPAVEPHSRRVLVVDDNPDNLQTTGMFLTMFCHDVRTASTGPEAIETAEAFKPDAVVLDIGLPGMDGYEVARRLRDSDCKSSLIVAVSGYGQEQDVKHALASGFDRHLTKPINLDELADLVASSRAA